jgi:hypothetical protein
MTGGHDNERQKTNQLDAEEGKPDSHARIGLHMGHVDQRLKNARNQDSVHKESTMGPLTPIAEITSTMAPKTGRFSTQFAWARVPRRYQSSPSS